jgi:hypothetical protein
MTLEEEDLVERVADEYESRRRPERERTERRLRAIEAEVSAIKDAIEAELRMRVRH